MINPTGAFYPNTLKGYFDERLQMEILEAPVWHPESGRWRALVNLAGSLAVVELTITVKGT